MIKKLLWITLTSTLGLVVIAYVLGHGWLGVRQEGGAIARAPIPSTWIEDRSAEQDAAAGSVYSTRDKQILFGDLHVHTTYSFDAFMVSLPMFQGEGVHPPADACDFARYCAGLDFWSINDHAEGLTPFQWAETKRVIRECQSSAGDPDSPDLVSFLGWEWTQIGSTPEDHYGHKNVVLRELDEDSIPRRPISSRQDLIPESVGDFQIGPALRALLIATSPGSEDRQPYYDTARFLQDRDDFRPCPEGVAVRDLPLDCQEGASTPGRLFEKLDDWGYPYLVIPHGNSWGFYTPPGTTWDKQLAAHDDPDQSEPLFEIFSGHGSSEPYRDWRAIELGPKGEIVCPAPSDEYLPSCWRAGEIIRERCLAAGESTAECEARAGVARQHHAEAGTAGHMTVPGARVEDWLDAGQCTDCYMPAFDFRPGGSGQYALAISHFDGRTDGASSPAETEASARPKRFHFGFIASSDNHTARPGTGYKEVNRREMTESGLGGFGSFIPMMSESAPRSVPLSEAPVAIQEFERFASFFGTGGLVAVHSVGRDRNAIWQSLKRKEVYGTSGDRMLLWFDLIDAPERVAPMGSLVQRASTPRFRVRAVGAFHQKPGCPDYSVSALSPERLHGLCRDECYNPSDTRKRIDRIEVIRIRPQAVSGEPVAGLIEDPWRVLVCDSDPSGCSVEFDDPDYVTAGRDSIYYVRAIQEPTPTVNASQLRCEVDEAGRCIDVAPCFGDPRTDYEDDCLAPASERAWSSPIFLEFRDGRGVAH